MAETLIAPQAEQLVLKLSDTQFEFCENNSRIVWLEGPAGEGKTMGAVAAIFRHRQRMVEYFDRIAPGKPVRPMAVAIIRDTHVNLKTNTIKSIQRAYPGLFSFRDDAKKMFQAGCDMADLNAWYEKPHNDPPSWIDASLFGMDDLKSLDRIQGGEYDLIWIEEPAPILSSGNNGIREEVYLVCAQRTRSTRNPDDPHDQGVPKRLQITMNPADEEHWTSRQQDNPIHDSFAIYRIKRGENRFLSDLDRQMTAKVFEGRADLYARFVEGKRAKVYDGVAVTPEFNESLHVAKEWILPDPNLEVIRCWDGGLTPSCLAAGSLVTLANGQMKPIEQVQKGDVVLAVYGNPSAVVAPATVLESRQTGIKPCLTIYTKSRRIRLTADHRVLSITKTHSSPGHFGGIGYRQMVWRLAGELRPGDEIYGQRHAWMHGTSYRFKESGLSVGPALTELIGAYFGDGEHLEVRDQKPHAIRLSAYHEAIEARWCAIYKEATGKEARPFRGTVMCCNAKLARDFVRAGLGQRSLMRRIPSWIYELPVLHRMRFLRGYLDSDGTVTKQGDIRFSTKNQGLIEDLWALCQSIGLRTCAIRKEVRMSGYKWVSHHEPQTYWSFTSRDALWREIGSTKWQDRIALRARLEKTRCTTVGLESETIVRIEQHEVAEPVYDLEVADAHSFIANGVVVHNCVLAQITPSGRLMFLDSLLGQNMGIEQLIETKLKYVLGRPRYQRVKKWRDIGDPSLKTPEAANSDFSAAGVIEDKLRTSYEPGVMSWQLRREALKFILTQMPSGVPMVQVSPRVTEGEKINWIKGGFAGGYCYKVTPDGRVVTDVPLKNAFSHPCDAVSHAVAHIWFRPKEQVYGQGKSKAAERQRAKGYGVG